MKKLCAVILSVFLTAGLAGCASPRVASPVDDTSSQQAAVVSQDGQAEILLTGTRQQSVYGVEAPGAEESGVFAQTKVLSSTAEEEMRGVWVAYVNYEKWIKNNTKAQFTTNIRKVLENIAESGFNTVFFQVRPFGDAMYDSDYFPWSRYLTGTEGKHPGYDPLQIVCTLAKEYDLRVEAWINPYRVRTDSTPMSSDNPAKKWQDKNNPAVVSWNGGLYYNPANVEARQLIVNGVTEIVKKYDVHGIHFDDYFYPTTDLNFDAADYEASGSKLSQSAWRRENVNKLVRQVYAAVKKADPSCQFGISPQGNMKINYDAQFIDVEKWLSNDGYIDYICPQIYYGYNNKAVPYAEAVAEWDAMIRNDVKLYVGVAAYKLGVTDQWAGDTGANEWIGTKDILARMVKTARGAKRYGGTVVYSYDSLFQSSSAQVKAEKANLEKLFR